MSDVILGEHVLELVAGEILVRSENGETIALAVKDGNLVLGGNSRDGDLMIRDRAGSITIAMNGDSGALHLGGPGQDGDITVRDAAFEQTAHLDGRLGDLDLKGRLTCQSLTQLSDARLKQDITPIDDALAAIRALTGVRYSFCAKPDEPRLGLLAQNVQDAAPEAVCAAPGGLAVDQGALIGLLVEAVKSLSREIDALKRRGG